MKLRTILATLAAIPALLLATASPAAASGTPAGASSVSWQGADGTVLCLAAPDRAEGASAVLAACDPGHRSQWWIFTKGGRLRLRGARLWLVPSETGAVLGPWSAAPSFDYVNHSLAAEGDWLTHCPADGPSPYLVAPPQQPACDTWLIFTAIGRTGTP